MRLDTRKPLLAKVACLLVLPVAARAAETLRTVDPADLAWWTWAFIFAFSTIGWAIAELDKLAEVLEPNQGIAPQERLRTLLKFWQGYIASLFAGIGTYFVSKVAPDWVGLPGGMPEMLILIAVTGAAFGGTRFLQRLLARFGFAAESVR